MSPDLISRAAETMVGLNEAYQRVKACQAIWPDDPSLEEDLASISEAALDLRLCVAMEEPGTLQAIEEAEETFCLVK